MLILRFTGIKEGYQYVNGEGQEIPALFFGKGYPGKENERVFQ